MPPYHECKQEETIGRFKEFMQTTKGLKATLATISVAILLQVGTFLYLWGGLTATVKKNTEHIWNQLTPCTAENTRNIDKILAKMDTWKEMRESKGVTLETVKR
jgi:hypothetical protein